MKQIFETVTNDIKEPITQDELEFMLVDAGVTEKLSQKEVNKAMKEFGFVKKQIMREGVRSYMWTNDDKMASPIEEKQRFVAFLSDYLKDLDVVPYQELLTALRVNNFKSSTWNVYFFKDEVRRVWRGWSLVDEKDERFYKKVVENVSN